MKTISFLPHNRIPYMRGYLRFPGPIPHSTKFIIVQLIPDDWQIVELRSMTMAIMISGAEIRRLAMRLCRTGEARSLRHAIELISGRGYVEMVDLVDLT